MGEIKSVKVDNWGVFFLQKLQNFFNKTDYCDLTLQFRDNSQLKVHRLVLSACTDYFNVLEQTCEVVDEALIMPNELQADVVVPIVNFMYTGTLEFELKMYGKLLRTAKEMNMTVLLKLLEAHRRTMEGVYRSQRPPSPKTIRRGRPPSNQQAQQQPQQQQQRRVLTAANASQQQRRVVQTKTIATHTNTQPQYHQTIGSTSLYRTTGTGTSPSKTQYTYDGQQQIKQEQDTYETSPIKQQPTSPFEQLRKGYNNNKRPASATFVSPPAKKPNIEDVKEFAEQQRMRKQIAAEYGDDAEYEGMLDDEVHNDDDDDDGTLAASSSNSAIVAASTAKVQQSHQGGATITFKHEQNDKPPTIVVKDSSNSKMNHAKIISEVLRQYPHLVKTNKNIKLKIMPNVAGQTQKIIVKKELINNSSTDEGGGSSSSQPQTELKAPVGTQAIIKAVEKIPAAIRIPPSVGVANASIATSTPATAATVAVGAQTQKRRIDSKTMHALIALGAENTTGPWLCLRCGVNGRPISIPSYRGFRRHLINTHKEIIDAALCEHCGWRSNNNRELHFHIQTEHKVKTTLYTFPECLMCAEIFLDTNALNQHMVDSHPNETKQQCIYCNKIFAKELQLYTHMKTYHKKQALEDGIIDYSDEEFVAPHEEPEIIQQQIAPKAKETKIKILSDISLPSASSLIKLEPSSEAAALSTVASGIATSIGITAAADEFMQSTVETVVSEEPKFINAEGNEMILTLEQRKEILSQLNHEHDNSRVVMVFNDTAYPTESTIESNDEEIQDTNSQPSATNANNIEEEEEQMTGEEASAIEDEVDDCHIYGELIRPKTTDDATAAAAVVSTQVDAKKPNLDESKGSADDHMEWAQNLISAHELADEEETVTDDSSKIAEDKAKKDDDISKKLKELTGDWSEDEMDDDDDDHVVDHRNNDVDGATTTTGVLEAADNEPVAEKETESQESTHDDDLMSELIHVKAVGNEDQQQQQQDVAADDGRDGDDDDVYDGEKVVHEEPEPANIDAEAKPSEKSAEEQKIDEDDIEMAMKSLHKDDSTDHIEAESCEASFNESKQNRSEDEDEVELKENKVEEQKDANEDDDVDEMKVEEKTKEIIEEEKPSSVISETRDEDIEAKDINASEGENLKGETPNDDDAEQADVAEDCIQEATIAAAAVAKNSKQEDEDVDDTIDKAVVKEEAVDDNAVSSSAAAGDEQKKNVEAKEEGLPAVTSSISSTTTIKPEEKVKSLISEWVDDDDDDDDELADKL